MEQLLSKSEIEKTQNLCFNNSKKACAVAQIIIDTCQIISCNMYSKLKNKNKRTIQYQAEKLTGIKIEDRKFISLNQ